jgi:hypothetical protein
MIDLVSKEYRVACCFGVQRIRSFLVLFVLRLLTHFASRSEEISEKRSAAFALSNPHSCDADTVMKSSSSVNPFMQGM